MPTIVTAHDSYDAARIVASIRGLLGRGTQRKIDTALSVFEEHVEAESLLRTLEVPRSAVVTPLMFESMLPNEHGPTVSTSSCPRVTMSASCAGRPGSSRVRSST